MLNIVDDIFDYYFQLFLLVIIVVFRHDSYPRKRHLDAGHFEMNRLNKDPRLESVPVNDYMKTGADYTLPPPPLGSVSSGGLSSSYYSHSQSVLPPDFHPKR